MSKKHPYCCFKLDLICDFRFQKIKTVDNMVDRAAASQAWSLVVEAHPVPPHLQDHQLNAMSLLKQGKHVFLGNLVIS